MTAPTVTCPAWCDNCFVDLDGYVYHRGADVPLVGRVTVQAFAGQAAGQDVEEPVFTITSAGLDGELTYDQTLELAQRLGDYLNTF